ncbi:flagellar hook-length control protein FliK [Azonexus sp.]|uniref:flagellar hook-length control protein FliK n=1 Tax=Azonexus sp. TaxID=1872668 RepID=UPI0035AFC6E3
MIPPDVASSLRLLIPDQHAQPQAQTQPVAAAQRIADVLGNLVPGQRIMAEIQAMLPNGTYRATVAQRDITLALPFSAKPGDSLELEVTESEGKLTLAVVTNRSGSPPGNAPQDSVATTLSRTGQLIGDLLGEIDNQGKRPAPAPLNGSQPLVETMPKSAADLAPVLKQALTQSGMFYEAHQARWVAGELPTARLLQEPQGQYSQLREAPATPLQPGSGSAASGQPFLPLPAGAPQAGPIPAPLAPGATPPATDQAPGTAQGAAADGAAGKAATAATDNPSRAPLPPVADERPLEAAAPRAAPSSPAAIPADLAPLVQQQLDALATQTYAWQGQIWPGQQMQWEIEEQCGERGRDDESGARWQTRLRLQLPQLGGIEAHLTLRPGGEIGIALSAEQAPSEQRLGSAAPRLREQLADAGLRLTQFTVKHDETSE